MGPAEYSTRGAVAVITLNNPPVNGLGHALRRGIVDGLDRAAADPGVKAVVLTGAGKGFSAGADIREFGTPQMTADPSLHAVIQAVEASPKPVVASNPLARKRRAAASRKRSSTTVETRFGLGKRPRDYHPPLRCQGATESAVLAARPRPLTGAALRT